MRCPVPSARHTAHKMSSFKLGTASEESLRGVHSDLVALVRRAIERTSQDFSVFEGLRSAARQRALFKAGASRTLESYHLTGEAVDLVPFVEGRLQWQQPLCCQIARHMHEASRTLSVGVVWGGVWDRPLSSLDAGKLEQEVHAYGLRWRAAHPELAAAGRGPLVDGPHFQRMRAV